MSLTIEQEPQLYSPVFNDLDFTLSSNNINGQNFFFYLSYLKDDGDNSISQYRPAPHYSNLYGLVRVARSLEGYCTHDFTAVAGATYGVQKKAVFKEYYLDFYEEYGAVASGLTTGSNLTSSHKYTFNGRLYDEEFNDYDYTDWVMASGSTDVKLCTDMRGANVRIKTADRFEIGWMTSAGATQPSKNVTIKTYNSSGSNIGTYKIANSFSSETTADAMFLGCLVGADDLNNSTLSSGSQPVITDAVSTYEVYIENNSGTRISEIMTFEIDKRCQRAGTPIRLFWVNRMGRIDAFNFNFESDRNKSVNVSTFQKVRHKWTGANYGYDSYEHGRTNFYTENMRSMLVRSDYLNNVESEWMENLVDSPAVWGLIDGKFIPLSMKTNTYKRRTVEKDMVFYVEFELEYSVNDYRQRL